MSIKDLVKDKDNKSFILLFLIIFMSLNIAEKKPMVIEILRNKGPCLPSQISSEIKLQLLFTSALLSEMVSDKSIRYSNLKIGGSPLYYLAGQESALENFTKHLHGKEKEAMNLLKEKGVLNETDLEPVQRVCLANIRDFAVPLKFTYKDQQFTFWRFYLVSEEEASKKIESYFASMPKMPKVETDKKIEEFEKPDEIQEAIKRLKEEKSIKPLHPVGIDERQEFEAREANKEVKIEVKEEQKVLHPELLHKKIKKRTPTKKKKDFTSKVIDYVKEKEMLILKNFEDDNKVCVAETESKIGSIKFLVFGMNKKSLNEFDLSLAYSEGQQERLPVLLVTNGKLTKKAEEYQKKFGNYLIVNKI